MPRERKERGSPSHEQESFLPLTRVRTMLLLFVFWSNVLVATAAEQYPWSSDAANVAGRILAISHVVNSSGQEAELPSKQEPPRFGPANREIDPGPVGSALSGRRISDVQIRSSQLQSETMFRMQEIRSRNQQMLAQSTAQMEALRSRNQEMLARSMSQRQDLQFRNQEMLARSMAQRQDIQYRNSQVLSQNMLRVQEMRFHTQQVLARDMTAMPRADLSRMDRVHLDQSWQRARVDALGKIGRTTATSLLPRGVDLFMHGWSVVQPTHPIPLLYTTGSSLIAASTSRSPYSRGMAQTQLAAAGVELRHGEREIPVKIPQSRVIGSVEQLHEIRVPWQSKIEDPLFSFRTKQVVRTWALEDTGIRVKLGIFAQRVNQGLTLSELPGKIEKVGQDLAEIRYQTQRVLELRGSVRASYGTAFSATPYSHTVLFRDLQLDRTNRGDVTRSSTKSFTRFRYP